VCVCVFAPGISLLTHSLATTTTAAATPAATAVIYIVYR
jgi:hypothetical protein